MTALSKLDEQISALLRDPPAIMTVPETAIYLRQSERKTWEDIRLCRIPSIKLGGRIILRRSDIDAALARLTRGHPAQSSRAGE